MTERFWVRNQVRMYEPLGQLDPPDRQHGSSGLKQVMLAAMVIALVSAVLLAFL